MSIATSGFRGFMWRCSGIAFAAAALALTPLPVAADMVSVSSFADFSEAGFAQLGFMVNPDGSLSAAGSCDEFGFPLCSGPITSAGLSWQLDGVFDNGFRGASPGLDFPALPPGSTINSATFSWIAGEGAIPAGPNSLDYNIVGSLGLQSINGPCGILAVSSDTGMCSFTPTSTAETFYAPDFSGGGNAMAVAIIPSEPGLYLAGINVDPSVTYTITENYSTTPEPRTYAFLIGLGLAGLFAIRSRERPEERA